MENGIGSARLRDFWNFFLLLRVIPLLLLLFYVTRIPHFIHTVVTQLITQNTMTPLPSRNVNLWMA